MKKSGLLKIMGVTVPMVLSSCIATNPKQHDDFELEPIVIERPKSIKPSEVEYFIGINKSEQMLYITMKRGDYYKTIKKYPVSTGKKGGNKSRKDDHKTPEGIYFTVADILIPGEAKFGPYFLRLKNGKLCGIHGTNTPWVIGTPVTKGCIRMYNKDIEEIVKNYVKVGTSVHIRP